MADSTAEPRSVQVGLTGGIGAGKSTVARLLTGHGAVVLDADLAARDVVAEGTEGLAAVAAEFGERVLAGDGTLDRAELARIVFGDESRRAALNAIVHPRVRAWMEQRAAQAPPGSVVVQDIPLLIESGLAGQFDLVVVVDAADEVRIDRLVRDRGMDEAQARARIAAQVPREQRLAAADVVVGNEGPLDGLTAQVDALWSRLLELRTA
jgi:dephospho-CoA kinase